MKRRYKLLIIILVGTLFTIIINGTKVINKISLVSLGDGLSIGMTPYNVAGKSYNDYLKEYLESANKLDIFNNEFSIDHLKIHELNEFLDNNKIGSFTRIPIKQTLAKADIITISIGIDELADISLRENISDEYIDNFLKEYEYLLKTIREFYDKKIYIIGIYPAYKLTKSNVIDINNKVSILCGKYNTFFVDILGISIKPEYYLENDSYYMNYKAHQEIAKLIYNSYKNSL